MHLRHVALLVGLLSASASAQVVDLAREHVAMTDLAGPWRFHTGDNPAWANPSFDDSAWSLLFANAGWDSQGYSGYSGAAWYRLQILLPPSHGPLALYIPSVDSSCQIFANGTPIGQIGGLPPHPEYILHTRAVFSIPEELTRSGRLQLSIRVWLDPHRASAVQGGLHSGLRIGDADAIEEWRTLQGRQAFWENSASMVELFANLIGALACLIVFALRRKEREYLWFGLYLLNWSAYHVTVLYSVFRPAPYVPLTLLTCLLLGLGPYLGAEYFVALARQKRGWLYAVAAFFALTSACTTALDRFWPGHLWDFAHVSGLTVYWFCLGAVLVRAAKEGARDIAILLLPAAWSLVESVFYVFAYFPPFLHHPWARAYLQFMGSGTRWPFPYFVPSLTGDLTNVVVLIVLIRRYAFIRRDEERLESEMDAARTVQKAHIPDKVPDLPGFRAQAVYKPASHVGGDFFQIVSVASGSTLIVIGDVSGKGMPAAMTASLLVGTFRTLAHFLDGPEEILLAMNHRVLARSNGGFTTCLVLRADPDGAVTIANAGHIPPYLDGRETPVANGLPLGISAEVAYPEIALRLEPGKQLTLVTDGVVEAQSLHRELFGFDRTRQISTQSAEAIAGAAQAFGQEDDITVLTLQFHGKPNPETSPAGLELERLRSDA